MTSQTDRNAGLVANVAFKAPVRAATTANITLSGLQTVDGVVLVAGNRVLVKNQNNNIENGIYEADTGAWTRAKDFNGAYDVKKGTVVFVTEGGQQQTSWQVTSSDDPTFGTSSITFAQVPLLNSDLSLGTVLSTGSTTARTLANRWADIVNVKDHGAVGNGVTLDTTALQTAINTGKHIYVPKVSNPATEYYRIDAQLNMQSNQIMFGDGAASIIRQITANEVVIDVSGKTKVVISNLKTYAVGSRSGTTDGCGVRIRGSSSHCRVEGVEVENHRGIGILIFNSNDCIAIRNTLINSPVLDSDQHSQVGADIAIQGASSRCAIAFNTCISGNGVGAQVQTLTPGDLSRDNRIIGNAIRDCRQYGIMLYKTDLTDTIENCAVVGNTVFNTTGATEEATNGFVYGTGIYVQGVEDSLVEGNVVDGSHTSTVLHVDTLAPGGIGSTSVTRVSIIGNIIRNANEYGITVRDPNNQGATEGHAIVKGNIVTDVNSKDAINVTQRGNVLIEGNVVDDVSSGSHGIRINNTVTKRPGISILGNVLKGVTGQTILASFCDGLVVKGNHSVGAGVHGIAINNSDDISILDNLVRTHTTRGIEIASTCTRGLLDGNNVRGTGTSTEGIRIDGNVDIGQNKVSNCTTNWVGDYVRLRGAPNLTNAANTSTGETDLLTFTLPANTFAVNEQGVNIVAWGDTANNANAKTVRLYFGAVILTTSLTTSQVNSWKIEARVFRNGSNSQKYYAKLLQGGTTTQVDVENGALTQTDTATITIKVTGQGGATNDITQRGMSIKFMEN